MRFSFYFLITFSSKGVISQASLILRASFLREETLHLSLTNLVLNFISAFYSIMHFTLFGMICKSDKLLIQDINKQLED